MTPSDHFSFNTYNIFLNDLANGVTTSYPSLQEKVLSLKERFKAFNPNQMMHSDTTFIDTITPKGIQFNNKYFQIKS